MASSSKSAAKPDPSILIGRVVRPHGVHGELRIEPLTDFPERFATLGRVYIDLPGGGRWWEVESVREGKDEAILMAVVGLDSPEEAATLRNGRLLLPRSEAMPLPEDVYYIDDLKGLRAEATDGTFLGKVREVYTAAQDLLEIRLVDGRDLLVPLVKAWVPVVDIAAGRVVVADWQALVLESLPDTDAPPAKPKKTRKPRGGKPAAEAPPAPET